jgi:redox-sensitive bicupin YhaK (pirin superfamily)
MFSDNPADFPFLIAINFMNYQLYPASERGKADHGWLKANFSFSFGNYFNPAKIQFGALRVLNDDTIAEGTGFGTHPHENMEIITIPLEGGLRHGDNMGNSGVIRFGEVQVMSAGTGVLHSELNASQTEQAKTLQLWIFPELENVEPRYDQKAFPISQNLNNFVTLVSPHNKIAEGSLWIYQQAFISLGKFDASGAARYDFKISGNGAYLFLISGSISVAGENMNERDAMGITNAPSFDISFNEPSTVLIIEVPMFY